MREHNFDYAFGMIDQYLAGISPVPMGATMFARMQLAGALGDPALNGVNTAGSFAIFGLSPPAESEANPMGNLFIAGLVPVTDYEKFVSDNPNCEQPDANGVSVIKTGGALNPDKKMLTTKLGGYVLLSSPNNYGKLLSIAKSVSQGVSGLRDSLDAGEVAAATNQPLWAYGNVQRAATVFGPMVYAQLEQMKKQFETMNASPQGGPAPAAVMNMYFGMFNILTEEVKSLSISVNPKADVLNLTISTAAVPNTLLAKMFVADTSGRANTLLGYAEDGAIINLGFKMNTPFVEELGLTEYDFIAFLGDEDISDETIAKLEKLVADMVSSAAGPGVISFSCNSQGWPSFTGKYVIAVKDQQKWNQVIEAGTDLWNTGGFADIYRKKMGMETRYEITRAADSYNDVSIDLGKFIMEPNDPNSFYGSMIDKIYGGGLELKSAMVDGLWLCVFGADSNSAIRELIDEVKAGGPQETASEMASALEALTEADKAEFAGTVNFIRYLNMAAGMMQGIEFGADAGQIGPPIVPVDVETNSNIAFAGKVTNGKIAVEIALPKQHILEIKAGVETMQQQMMVIMARRQAISQLPLTEGPESGTPTDYTLTPDVIISPNEETAIQGLRTFAEISNGRYPGSLDLMTTVKEAGEALRISLLKDPNTTITEEEVMRKFIQIEATSLFYAKLVKDGNDVTYYGKVTTEFPHAVLMHWKISEDKYRVIFADLTAETVTAERLAELEALPLNLTPKAIKPQPQDGAVAVPVAHLELSWLPGINAAEHRVYLGTSPDELLLLGGLTSPFTKPQPQDGAVAVPVVEVELSSMPGFNAAEHRIHLGTSPDELSLLGGLTSPFTDRVLYVTSAELQVDTTYYWRVDEVQTDGSIVVGDVWSFNTNRMCLWWKFDETSGRTVSDSSGSGYTGILAGENNWNPDGYNGGCLSFDDDTAISVPTEALSSIDRQITISIWLYGYDSTGRDNYVFDTGTGDTFLRAAVPDIGNNVVFRAGGTDDVVTWSDSNSDERYPPTLKQIYDPDPPPVLYIVDWRGSWKHYVFVKNGETLRIYCDGQMVAEKTNASASISGVRNQPFDIGALVAHINDYKGKMDDLRIYNCGLSDDEIGRIYKGTDAASVEK